MSFIIPVGVFAFSIFLMVAILVRKHILIQRGMVVSHEIARTEHFSRFFSVLHDLERGFMRVSFSLGERMLVHTRTALRRGAHAFFHKTPMKKISEAISGRKEMHKGVAEPSAYLKDMTNHRDHMRENGAQEQK